MYKTNYWENKGSESQRKSVMLGRYIKKLKENNCMMVRVGGAFKNYVIDVTIGNVGVM